MDDTLIISVLTANGSNFAQSLLSSYNKWGKWTPKQRACAEQMVRDSQAPKQAPQIGPFKGIVDLFTRPLSLGLKRPGLHFILDGNKLTITCAPAKRGADPHPNAGCLYVKHGGAYSGKITPGGVFAGRHLAPSVSEFLEVFAKDPLKVGSEYGRKSGCCCFCGLNLTDGRSISKGYGPICARHWELPWGDTSEDNLKKSEQSDVHPDIPIIQLTQAAKASSADQQQS